MGIDYVDGDKEVIAWPNTRVIIVPHVETGMMVMSKFTEGSYRGEITVVNTDVDGNPLSVEIRYDEGDKAGETRQSVWPDPRSVVATEQPQGIGEESKTVGNYNIGGRRVSKVNANAAARAISQGSRVRAEFGVWYFGHIQKVFINEKQEAVKVIVKYDFEEEEEEVAWPDDDILVQIAEDVWEKGSLVKENSKVKVFFNQWYTGTVNRLVSVLSKTSSTTMVGKHVEIKYDDDNEVEVVSSILWMLSC